MEEAPRPLTIEEILREQQNDSFCIATRARMEKETDIPFIELQNGLLARRAKLDNAEQIVLPKSLQERALYFAHYPVLAGHPGGTRMYHNLRRQVFWPAMALDVYQTVRNCVGCAKERVKWRKNTSFLKTFPATAPLEFVGIDLLGPLRKTSQGHEYLLIMTDRFSKFVKAVPLKSISAYAVARAFCEHWVFNYGPPRYVLSDDGKQFASKFFIAVCGIPRVRNLFTSTYHPQTNGQTERFNRTILAGLRHFIAEDQTD